MLRVLLPLVYLLLYSFSVCSVPGAVAAPVVSKPNILLLLADDLGYNDSDLYREVYGQAPVLDMPSLAALGKEGVRFTRFYTESTCSASRVALLTGQYPARQGFMPAGRGISPDVVTLPETLRARGYATYHVGKWHAGEFHREAMPAAQGFDHSFGFLNQWLLQGMGPGGAVQLKAPTYHNPWLVDERGVYRQYPGHLEDILAHYTVQLLQQPPRQPWFIYHAFLAPHTPLQAPQVFMQQEDDTEAGKFRAQLRHMDANLEKILKALKASGQWDNTIIIFASDNGSSGKFANSNAPFDGSKGEYAEGGIRTPLVIKWHRALTENLSPQDLARVRRDVVSIMDIYPSLQAVTGSSFSASETEIFDGQPHLLPAVHGRGAVPDPTPQFFLSFDALSVFDELFQRRLVRQWSGGEFTDESLLRYRQDGRIANRLENIWSSWFDQEPIETFPDDSLPTDDLSKNKIAVRLHRKFLHWYQQVSVVPVQRETVKKADGQAAYRSTGRDFVRSPVNASFAVAFAFQADEVVSAQTLLSQAGLLAVSLEQGRLSARIHTLQAELTGIQPGQCYRVVVSGEFHDRYSGVQEAVLPSRLHLLVNGKVVASSNGTIMDLSALDISAPTYAGIRDEKDHHGLKGKITAPQFFVTQLLPGDPLLADNVKKIDGHLCEALLGGGSAVDFSGK